MEAAARRPAAIAAMTVTGPLAKSPPAYTPGSTVSCVSASTFPPATFPLECTRPVQPRKVRLARPIAKNLVCLDLPPPALIKTWEEATVFAIH